MNKIQDVEIFGSGTWNGHEISSQDLDDMVESFNKTSRTVRPYIKLGHNEEQALLKSDGLPSAGWVDNLRRKGDKLVADFVDVPNKIKKLIENKAYRNVSSEVFTNIDILGEKHKKMLGAVALLGAETPAVMNLDDILAWYSIRPEFEAVNFANETKLDTITYENDFKGEFSMSEEKNLNPELDQLKNENEELKAKLSDSTDKFSTLEAAINELKEQNKRASQEIIEAKQREEDAKVSQFVSELKSEDLVSPAMSPYLKELFSNKQEFSIEDKTFDKFSIVKEILSLSKEFNKMNFSETTENTENKNNEEAKLLQFAKDNNLDLDKDFSKAYRLYAKSKEA